MLLIHILEASQSATTQIATDCLSSENTNSRIHKTDVCIQKFTFKINKPNYIPNKI